MSTNINTICNVSLYFMKFKLDAKAGNSHLDETIESVPWEIELLSTYSLFKSLFSKFFPFCQKNC